MIFRSEIRKSFPDGVLLIPCGAGVSDRDVVSELGKIVRETGGENRASIIESSSVKYAISVAADWFNYRQCLFLVKDTSRSEDEESEDLTMLKTEFCAGLDSQMVIGSRSRAVAANCEQVVCIEPTDQYLIGVFLARSLRNNYPELISKTIAAAGVRSIVAECEGIPFAAALAGNGVRCQTRRAVDFGTACWKYRDDLHQQRDVSESVIDATLSINLRYLESDADFKNKSAASLVFFSFPAVGR